MKIHPFAFPPERRIHKHSQFQTIFETGKKYYCQHYLLFAALQQGEPQRIGFAVSRKIGNAVARNRVKRVLRELFRQSFFSLPGMQMIVVARKGAPCLGLAEAKNELWPRLLQIGGFYEKPCT